MKKVRNATFSGKLARLLRPKELRAGPEKTLLPIPEDPSFPQLDIARNPERMRRVFQRRLRPLGEEAYQIQECRIPYVDYQQGLSCKLQYKLRVVEPSTGRERSQVVTGVMLPGDRTRRIWNNEIQRSELGGGTSGASPIFEPFSYIRKLDMLVQVFPYDYGLPALPLLMKGPPPELEPLLLARFGPGNWQVEAWYTDPIRYLAEVRGTLRYTVRARDAATNRVEERRFYAKVYRDGEQGKQTYRVLKALWDKASAGSVGFTTGRPIAYLSSLQTVVQEEVSGTTLLDMNLWEDDSIPIARKLARGLHLHLDPPIARKLARALAALHLEPLVPLRPRSLQHEVAILKSMGKILQSVYPHLEPKIEETVGIIVASLEEVPPAPTHTDLSLQHIMLSGDRLALIDLDEFAEADPVLDVAHIFASLGIPALLSPPLQNRMRTLAQAFAEEYFTRVPETWYARLPFHYAGTLLKAAVGCFQQQLPEGPYLIEALLEEAKDVLAGRVWWCKKV